MTRILLIRHAMTNTAGKLLSGRMPGIHLNAEGIKQAAALAERLHGLNIAAIYCSPLERATETAMPLANLLQTKPICANDFNEIDFGEWTGRSIADLQDDAVFRQFNMFRSGTPVPGGEWISEAQLRITKGIKDLCIRHPGETVAIFSHADLVKAAIIYYAGMPVDFYHRIEISPASVSILEMFEEMPRIITLNNTGMISF
jgi:broad specificity phosphatase PhoE